MGAWNNGFVTSTVIKIREPPLGLYYHCSSGNQVTEGSLRGTELLEQDYPTEFSVKTEMSFLCPLWQV